ncbi:hypothetical protein WSM22_27680 [Cytophagales bacterium WSM2-2]|nr:hypothetical protein WSM22_27680 [Cytophagales bacterium WSM2-2]
MIYWLKVTYCSAILLFIYHVFLEREKIHSFNRFFLLFAIGFSFGTPFLIYQSEFIHSSAPARVIIREMVYQPALSIPSASSVQLSWFNALLFGYAIISLTLAVRFIINLAKLNTRVRNCETIAYQNSTLVLLSDSTPPHSFLKFIFVNRQEFEQGKVEKEVLEHELTHVTQLHSVDVLVMELLLIFAWINPILFLYRRAIQLNHEFLADEKVIQSFDPRNYQLLLLSKLTSPKKSYPLSSTLTYLLTKKRFLMMTKKITPSVRVKQVMLVPMLVALGLLFCEQVYAQDATVKEEVAPTKKNYPTPPVVLPVVDRLASDNRDQSAAPEKLLTEYKNISTRYLRKTGAKSVIEIPVSEGKRLEEIFLQMNREQQLQQRIVFLKPLPPLSRTTPTDSQLNSWKDSKFGVWIDDVRISNSELSKYSASDFGLASVSKLLKGATNYGKEVFQVNLMTEKYYQEYYNQTVRDTRNQMVFLSKNQSYHLIRN